MIQKTIPSIVYKIYKYTNILVFLLDFELLRYIIWLKHTARISLRRKIINFKTPSTGIWLTIAKPLIKYKTPFALFQVVQITIFYKLWHYLQKVLFLGLKKMKFVAHRTATQITYIPALVGNPYYHWKERCGGWHKPMGTKCKPSPNICPEKHKSESTRLLSYNREVSGTKALPTGLEYKLDPGFTLTPSLIRKLLSAQHPLPLP